MFQEFYGFSSLPFSRTIATKDLFPTASQKELGARLTYLARERGFGLVTGEIGSGKSTAVRAFAASLDFNRYLVVYLANRPPASRVCIATSCCNSASSPPSANRAWSHASVLPWMTSMPTSIAPRSLSSMRHTF